MWNHFNPVNIISGAGILDKLPDLINEGSVLLVTTQGSTKRGITPRIIDLLSNHQILVCDEITPNPELDDLDRITGTYKDAAIKTIVAIGGGSVLDAAKVLSVTLPCNDNKRLHSIFRESKAQLWQTKITTIAIPTTSGTGAEVTPFATVWDATTHLKHSVGGKLIYPDVALLDPNLTLSLPYQDTLYTGLDAISHALESLWNKNRTAVSETFAYQALTLANHAFLDVLANSENLAQREKMQVASMLAGLAISQTRTAIAHSISYPLTSLYDIPHGLACSFTLENICADYLNSNIIKASDIEIIERTKKLLSMLPIREQMAQYVTDEDLKTAAKIPLNKDRSNNFSLEITSTLQYILEK